MKSKVVALGGKHRSLSSVLYEILGDETQKSGLIFSFNGESVMSTGHFGLTRAQTCMAAVEALTIAIGTMQPTEDDPDE